MHLSKRLTRLFAFHSEAVLILNSLQIRKEGKHTPASPPGSSRAAGLPSLSRTYHLRRAKRTTDRVTVSTGPLASRLRNPQPSIAPRRPSGASCRGMRRLMVLPLQESRSAGGRRKRQPRKHHTEWVPGMCSFSQCLLIKRKEEEGKTKGFCVRQ